MTDFVSAAIIKGSELFVMKRGHSWLLPHGKLRAGKSDLECLMEGMELDLGETRLKDVKFYREFNYVNDRAINNVNRVYLAKLDGEMYMDYYRVKDIRWFDHRFHACISPMTLKVMQALRRDGLLSWYDKYDPIEATPQIPGRAYIHLPERVKEI
jgi:hypothetical protein